MVEKILVPVVCGIGTVLITLAGVAVHKIGKMSKQYDKGVKDLSGVTAKDIQESIIHEAVENAAKDQVHAYILRAHDEVLRDARTEIRKEVGNAVLEAKNDLREKVEDTIAERVANIDIDDMKRHARERAEKTIMDKFGDGLEDIAEKYGNNLKNISKIFEVFANKMQGGNDGKKVTFSLG